MGCLVTGVQRQWTVVSTLVAHQHFVGALAKVSSSSPGRSFISGSNDKTAILWENDQSTEVLTGHSGAVSSVGVTGTGTLITGSWDKSARVWTKGQCLHVLEGHEAAVWAVLGLPNGDILTGAADKVIRLWSNGQCIRKYQGHEDAVRGLALVPNLGFMSCSNDGTVRLWSTASSECLHITPAHDNYVYSIALLPNGQYVTASEDRNIKIWRRDGECVQTISHPGVAWSVSVLPNGDIVTGCSDGTARVFTRDTSRAAPEIEREAFELKLANQKLSTKAIGQVQVDKLPGMNALEVQGMKDGESKIVRNGETAEVYQWSMAEQKWAKIGDVVEGGDGTEVGKKVLYGKEYDFIFDVDLGDKVPRKLGYNRGDNPYLVAQKFIWDNDLGQDHLDQIGRWITAQVPADAAAASAPSAGFDPYTGGSRYVPGSAPASSPALVPKPGSSTASSSASAGSPFTLNRYVPGTSNVIPKKEKSPYKHFPKEGPVLFEAANFPGIVKKLQEFNTQLAGAPETAPLALSAAEWKQVERVMDIVKNTSFYHSSKLADSDFLLFIKLLRWPTDKMFPVLDLLRLTILHPSAAKYYAPRVTARDPSLSLVFQAASPSSTLAANRLLAVRFLCNMFGSVQLREAALQLRPEILDSVVDLSNSDNANIRMAFSTVLLNYAVSFRDMAPSEEASMQLLVALSELLSRDKDVEVLFRALVALGTLIYKHSANAKLATELGISSVVATAAASVDVDKVKEVCNELQTALASV
mmetsp:Transcript_30033/g.48525  ORF Transcript_30033/g.48525 Transcript_30033/m.48525 type:complete len:755 (+) Transcript_30033:13-2277(+)